jgi:hypothetical protein
MRDKACCQLTLYTAKGAWQIMVVCGQGCAYYGLQFRRQAKNALINKAPWRNRSLICVLFATVLQNTQLNL